MDLEKDRMRLQLCKLIEDWNANRLDLFALSQPNQDLEFHGVMRFFFQEAGQKVATKCIRVSSTATTRAVIDALIEKFHPDLRMLSTPRYSLWEVHENGEERQLRMDEKPLLVQLNWHKDDREGRFLLRDDNADNKTLPLKNIDSQVNVKQMKRKLSRREQKEQKKKEKRAVREAEDVGSAPGNLYAQVPPTTFTRTISNPEIVMKKRRERKLAEKLKNIGEGGSLKIYGEEVSGGTKPYVTLLVSIRDRANRILKEALEKYGIDYQRHGNDYYLAEVRSPLGDDDEDAGDDELEHRPGQPQTERALDDDDCPLLIYAHDTNRANITFHVRRKTPSVAREVETRRKSKCSLSDANNMDHQSKILIPYLIELNPDGSESGKKHLIHPNVTEVGNDRTLNPPYGLSLHGPFIHPRHCVLAYMDSVVTATPCSPNADLRVDEKPITETTVLYPGQTVRIGQTHLFRFVDAGAVNGDQDPQAALLKRTPSEQGMVRSISTPISTNPTRAASSLRKTSSDEHTTGLAIEGQRFATTFDVDGDVTTFVMPIIAPAKPTSPVLTSQGGGPNLVGESHVTVDTLPPSLTPTPVGSVGQQVDNHYRLPTATPLPNQSNQQFASTVSLPQHRRTPPNGQPGPARPAGFGRDAIPAIIELLDNSEDDFLAAIMRDTKVDRIQFKLAPAYVVYMCCRYRASPHYRTGISLEERGRRLAEFLSKVVGRLHVTIQDHCHEAVPLAFWMANCSELLNFVKLDADLNLCTSPEPQESMADAIQKAYDHLVAYFKQELHSVMPPMLDLALDDQASTSPCVHMLSGTMNILRHCRVNAALTIQIFSQLFHYVNMYLFNWLVSREGSAYCTRQWGIALRRRLADVQGWSEKQGLEAAADCRLERILQTSQLLQMQKSMDNFSAVCSATNKLNSLQLRSILERYRPEVGEAPGDRILLENAVKVAEEQVDDALRLEGQVVQLEEELDLQLPFLLPDDGYSPQVVRGIPNGLREFVENFLQRSICRMILQPSSSGSWMVHMAGTGGNQVSGYQSPTFAPARSGSISSGSNAVAGQTVARPHAPEIVHISFHKGDGGIGLSIIQAQGVGQTQSGIYVKNVVPGSSAARDGRLEAGDQLLKVNGQSLVGVSQEVAAKIMGASGPTVHFEVAKGAVLYDGLATVVYQQSPDVSRRAAQQAAASRVRSVEHLSHHQSDQRNDVGHAAMQPGYSNAPVHRQPDQQQVQHQRHPSSSSIQHGHYYHQQQQLHANAARTGPPPVQYHIQQQYKVPNHARSMSASNLKDEPTTPTEVRRHLLQQQIQYPRQPSEAPSQKAPVLPPVSAQVSIPQRYQDQQASVEEQYYQNLAQYQAQQRAAQATGSVARRMSASDYSGPLTSGLPQRQQSASVLAPAYANQEYHRLPSAVTNEQAEQRPDYGVHRAHRNTDNGHLSVTSACALLASGDSSFPHRAVTANGGVAYQQGTHPSLHPRRQSDSREHHYNNALSECPVQPPSLCQSAYYQNLPSRDSGNAILSQVPWNRPGTPSAHDGGTSPPRNHSRQASYQQDSPLQHLTNQYATAKMKEASLSPPHQTRPALAQRTKSTDLQDPMRYPTPNNDYGQSIGQVQEQRPQPLQQRLGQEVAAIASAGRNWQSVEEEDRERQIQAEVERLMHEEVVRMEAKEYLTDEEQRRYRALKFELEYRRRLHSVTNDNDGAMAEDTAAPAPASIGIVDKEFGDVLRSMEPSSNSLQHETNERIAIWRNSSEQREELETSVKRQQVRDRYFEEAEHRYREAAMEMRMKEGGQHDQDPHRVESEIPRPPKQKEDEDLARMHINELQAKLQNMAVDNDDEPNVKTNGYASPISRAPEVPPKRKVVFSDAPEMGAARSATPCLPQTQIQPSTEELPSRVEETTQQYAKRYVYDQTPEDQQPRAQVIGGQEVYRDPRQERLKSLQQRKQPAETEKLSFKDKMRLFAAEIGESTPKDRLKASSAQRDIENGPTHTVTG